MTEDRDQTPAGAPKGADSSRKTAKQARIDSGAAEPAATDQAHKAKKNAAALSAALRANLARRKTRERALRDLSAPADDSEG